MSRSIYKVAHILASLIVFAILFLLEIYLFSELLYFDNKLISSLITIGIFVLTLLFSLFAGKKFSVWLRRKGNYKLTLSLVILLALLNFGLVSLFVIATSSLNNQIVLENSVPEKPTSTENKIELPQDSASTSIPKFPLPAPPASATIVLPAYFFDNKEEDKIVYLRDVNQTLDQALISAGYLEKSYFAVPEGFAMVTRLEQTNADGTPKRTTERWATEISPLRSFSLKEYLNALFTANPGYYRIIVFIVTPHPFSQQGDKINRDEAVAWLQEGLNKLPRSIGQQVYSDEYTSTALIYEFEQLSSSENGQANLKTPGRLPGKTHLVKAGIWDALEK